MLTTKLLSQGYQKTELVATLKKFYGRYHNQIKQTRQPTPKIGNGSAPKLRKEFAPPATTLNKEFAPKEKERICSLWGPL